MTLYHDFLYPTILAKSGYSVSYSESNVASGKEQSYELNGDGSLCDVYVVAGIELSMAPLLGLRRFVKEKGGEIYCERIFVTRGNTLMESTYNGIIIVWTSQTAYTSWNNITELIIDEEDGTCANMDYFNDFYDLALAHTCGYIGQSVIASEISRGVAERYKEAQEKSTCSQVPMSAEAMEKFVDPFRIMLFRNDDLQSLIFDETSFQTSCNILRKLMLSHNNKPSNGYEKMVIFIFWPQDCSTTLPPT
jgi:hypothetical protein